MPRPAWRTPLLALALWLAVPEAAVAQKTDVVELANGDRITCEIQKLQRGKLTVKTDGIGTVSIEWDDVDRVTSTASYEIELASGRRVYGSLARGAANTLEVVAGAERETLLLDDVIRMTPLGGTFWKRLDGSFAAGFNFTQANLQAQWSFNGDVVYRGRRWLAELTADSLLTAQEDAERQTRNTITFQGQRFLRPRWSYVGILQAQQNEELSLNLRALVGGGIARVLLQSNRTSATVLGALVLTREEYAGEGDESVLEAAAGGNWAWFTFDGRSTSLDLTVLSFYALTRSARTRLELNSSFRSDIVGDLYWSVNAFESFNSAPPIEEKKSDFGVSATVGWSF